MLRNLLLALCCFSLAALAYDGWLCAHFGTTGITLQRSSSSATKIGVEPGSAGYRAGLRTGDTVDLRALRNSARYRWYENVVAGERFVVPLRGSTGVRLVVVPADPSRVRPLLWVALAGFAWLILFGGLLAWRRGESPEARTLALLLMLFPTLTDFQRDYFYTPWIRADLAVDALGAFQVLLFTLLASYALLFRLPHPSLRRVLAALAYASGVVAAVFSLVIEEARIWTGTSLPPSNPFFNYLVVATLLFSLLCALVTVGQARGVERVRVAWVTASLGSLYALIIIEQLGQTVAGVYWFTSIVDVACFLAPVGLWCSLLNRRVLDIGFALNRAAVFTGVSIIIVGIFVLVEWALSEWFSSASHTTNLAISALLALALGLSVRAVHTRVDRALDLVFFRRRHEDEQAIRTLAREAAYVTDPQILTSRMVAVLEEHAEATGVKILLGDGAGQYGEVSENDPAIVRLRATQETLDLSDVKSAIPGEFAYPMLARGRLVGVLVLGPKRSGESYAPDESDAIAQLAHDAGAALDVLSAKGDGRDEAILRGIASLGERLHELSERIVTAFESRASDAHAGMLEK